MTAAMPAILREGGRRLNAMSQGGLPQDIADAVTFLATPGAAGGPRRCVFAACTRRGRHALPAPRPTMRATPGVVGQLSNRAGRPSEVD